MTKRAERYFNSAFTTSYLKIYWCFNLWNCQLTKLFVNYISKGKSLYIFPIVQVQPGNGKLSIDQNCQNLQFASSKRQNYLILKFKKWIQIGTYHILSIQNSIYACILITYHLMDFIEILLEIGMRKLLVTVQRWFQWIWIDTAVFLMYY